MEGEVGGAVTHQRLRGSGKEETTNGPLKCYSETGGLVMA